MRRRTVAGALVAVAALAGCGSEQNTAEPAPESRTTGVAALPSDLGLEVIDGVLYPSGAAVGGGAVGRTRTGWILSSTHLVIVDTSTGERLVRRPLDGGSVAAVHGDEVLVTDPRIQVFTVDGGPELLPFGDDRSCGVRRGACRHR